MAKEYDYERPDEKKEVQDSSWKRIGAAMAFTAIVLLALHQFLPGRRGVSFYIAGLGLIAGAGVFVHYVL